MCIERKNNTVEGEISIEEIPGKDNLTTSSKVIRDAFKTVALEFNLTKDNCPTHPSFITVEQLSELRGRGLKFFEFFLGNRQIGFVAVERADGSLYYIEKLAVLPQYRHSGYGRKLVEFAFEYIRINGGKRVSIGIINEHTVLKDWYRELGFEETSTKMFPHLPFTVCFMEKNLFP